MLFKGVTQSKVYTRSEYKEYLQRSKARSALPLSSLGAHSSAHEPGVAGAQGAAANEGSESKSQERGADGLGSSALAVSPMGGLNCKNIFARACCACVSAGCAIPWLWRCLRGCVSMLVRAWVLRHSSVRHSCVPEPASKRQRHVM